MQLILYRIEVKSIIKICCIGLVGYLPLMLWLTFSMINQAPYPVTPDGVVKTVGWVDVLYTNLYIAVYVLINTLILCVGLWVWSRFFEIQITAKKAQKL